MERHRNAVSEFREAARTNPKFADAHNNLGLTLLRTHRLDEALASFREAARVSAAQSAERPHDPFARANMLQVVPGSPGDANLPAVARAAPPPAQPPEPAGAGGWPRPCWRRPRRTGSWRSCT